MEMFCNNCSRYFTSDDEVCPNCKSSDVEILKPEGNRDSYPPGSAEYNDMVFGTDDIDVY